MALSLAARRMVGQDADPVTAPSPQQAAGRAAKKRLRIETALLLGAEGVNSQDVGLLAEEAAIYALGAAEPNLPAAAPAWALAMNAQMNAQMNAMNAQMNAQMNAMNAQMNGLAGQLNTVIANQANSDARLFNSVMNLGDPLVPLQTAAGIVPVGFPAQRADVLRLTGAQLSQLLTAYGQPVPPLVDHRRRAFAVFIGVRLG